METANASPQRQFTGWHFLAIMVAFFGTIIAVNVTMAMLASSSWTGLIAKNGYVASQEFNKKLAAAREQKARGWSGSFSYEDGRVRLTLGDASGKPVILDEARVTINHPVSGREDQVVPLISSGNGVHLAEIALDSGMWEAIVEGTASGLPYRAELRMFVGTDGRGRIQ